MLIKPTVLITFAFCVLVFIHTAQAQTETTETETNQTNQTSQTEQTTETNTTNQTSQTSQTNQTNQTNQTANETSPTDQTNQPNQTSPTTFSRGDIVIPFNSFNLGGYLDVNYELSSDSTQMIMTIKCNRPNQFFGIGFGASMYDADIWAFEIVDSALGEASDVRVSDYYSRSQSHPSRDALIGGRPNVTRLGYEITPNYTLVKVRRALNTGDQYDKVIQIGLTDFIFATGNSRIMAYHGTHKGTAQVALLPNPQPVETETEIETGESVNEEEMMFSEEAGFEENNIYENNEEMLTDEFRILMDF